MEKSVDYYMSLPYTVELKPDGKGYRASVKELPGCKATAKASEGVEKLWGRLKEDQRRRIEELLEFGDEVPEPAGTGADPFWASFPDGLDEQEAETMLYRGGATLFPLRILVELWLRKLQSAGLSEVGTPGAPPRGGAYHLDQTVHAREGDLRLVCLGEGRQPAWVKLDGPRTGRGYRGVDLLDQPLRTEAAVVAALTVLEASVVRDVDFERLRQALLEHAEAHPEPRERNLQEVLTTLPTRWFAAQKAAVDEVARRLPPKERSKHLGQSWERWERTPLLWRRSLGYMVALLRYRRPGFDARPLTEQLDLLDQHRKRVNKFLVGQRRHAAVLEYGTPEGVPKAVKSARDQVKAAVLADVGGLRHLDIAVELGLDVPVGRYAVDMKIPQVGGLVRAGRLLLDEALGGGGWQRKAQEMRAEADRYGALSEEDKQAEALAEGMGWTLEDARGLYRTNPGLAGFLATPLHP